MNHQFLGTPSSRPAVANRRRLSFGPELTEDGVRFRLWAPKARAISLKLAGGTELLPMQRAAGGWFVCEAEGTGPGTRYNFVLEDGTLIPDPGSRFQPEDIFGPSEVSDPKSFCWTDANWRGRPWEETVLYELHIGTFSPEGTFRAVIDRLDHLASLGVTAIELMPVNDFPGRYGWGYDGVLPFAPDSSYGRPEDLKALVDAAHGKGLSVFLDVVYNHFGPEGNFISIYAPLFTDKHKTPWGAAINYDDQGSDEVRQLVVENVCYWLEEFHIDGLRFDAVHEIRDDSAQHLLADIAVAARRLVTDRPVHLVLENAHNQSHWLARSRDGKPRAYEAQWNDDLHHCLHVAATDQDTGYYADFHGRTDLLGRALAEGFAYQGETLGTIGKPNGEPSLHLPPTSFVAFAQNHDQIGNRAYGERLVSLASREACRAVAAVYLLSPQIPMLFMGEEWGTERPFLYFTDIQSLAENIRKGRKQEFSGLHAIKEGEEPPDPMIPETVEQCRLDWEARNEPRHAEWLQFYSALLQTRRTEIVPHLFNAIGSSGRYELLSDGAVRVDWTLGQGARLTLFANLSGDAVPGLDFGSGRQIWTEGQATERGLGPWSVCWRMVTPAVRQDTD